MGKVTRDKRIESRTGRSKLPINLVNDPLQWRLMGRGLYLGYRKGIKVGKWVVRFYNGERYIKQVIGKADDFQDANDRDVLSFYQAADKTRKFPQECVKTESDIYEGPYSVSDAVRDYLEWFKVQRKSYHQTKSAIDYRILPTFKNIPINELTTKKIRKWHHSIAESNARLRSGKRLYRIRPTKKDDPDSIRRRKGTSNRILTTLKAALNNAFREGHAKDDTAWRRVKPFGNVNIPRVRYLSKAECSRLINGCEQEFRKLVKAALLTGARYGEIITMQCDDYHADSGTVLIREAKNSKPRHIYLTKEGQKFFESVNAGKPGKEILFKRIDGTPWRRSHQGRPMAQACQAAKIDPPISFHILRHTYGSLLALKGVSMPIIAFALGHSDTRITERHYAHLQPSHVADTIRANLPEFGLLEKDIVKVLRK